MKNYITPKIEFAFTDADDTLASLELSAVTGPETDTEVGLG